MAGSLLLGDPPIASLARRRFGQTFDMRLHAAQASAGFGEHQYLVARQRFAPPLQVFLEFGLGVLVRDIRILCIQKSREPSGYGCECSIITRVEADRRDQRLQCIRQDRVPVASPGGRLPCTQTQFSAQAEFTGQPGKGFLAHEAGAQSAQLPFPKSRIAGIELGCNAEVKEGIAEKLKAFVVGLAETRVREC